MLGPTGKRFTRIIPSAHAQTNVENWPLPWFRCEVILFVRIRDKRIIRSHHRDIEVNKIPQKWTPVRILLALRH